MPGRLPEDLAAKVLEAIVESDNLARSAHEFIGEGRPHTESERVGHKDDNENGRRGGWRSKYQSDGQPNMPTLYLAIAKACIERAYKAMKR